jgi:TP901 family phage tail tape measure protein
MGATAYSINTAFGASDGVSAVFEKMSRGVGKFGKKSDSVFSRIGRSMGKMATVAGGNLIAGGVTKGLGLITQGARAVTSQFIDLDDAIVSAAAKFKDVNLSTKNGRLQLDKLRTSAREAGKATVFNAAESAKGLEFLAMAGFTSAQAMASLNTIQNLAIATNSDFSQAADQSSDLLGAFGLASKDAAQNMKNFTRLNDVLTKTANSANVTLDDMFETMKDAGPIARKYGIELEEVAAITGILGSAGIKGSKGATALKNIMLNLASPTSKAAVMLKGMGVNASDADGNMRKISTVMGEVGAKLKGMGTQKQLTILDEIFGKRAIAGAANIADLIPEINALEESLLNAGGTAKMTAEQMSKSLGNQLKAISSALSEIGFKLIDTFSTEGATGLTNLTTMLRDFDVSPIIAAFKGLHAVLKPVVSLLGVFFKIGQSIGAAIQFDVGIVKKLFDKIRGVKREAVLTPKDKAINDRMNTRGKGSIGNNQDPLNFLPSFNGGSKLKTIEEIMAASKPAPNNETQPAIIAPNQEKEDNKRAREANLFGLGRGAIDINVKGHADVETQVFKGSQFTFNEEISGMN